MTVHDIFNILQKDIHSAVFATLDENGLPQTCVIDLMLADESGLYFLTAKGKSFYDRLTARPFVALFRNKCHPYPLHLQSFSHAMLHLLPSYHTRSRFNSQYVV